MQYNNSTNKELSLYHDALSLVGIDETDTTTLPIATFTRYANAWNNRLGIWAWRNNPSWHFDDKNHTDFPEATTTLVAGQEDYAIPTTAIDILDVYIMNSSGDYQKLQKIEPFNLGQPRDEYMEEDGTPMVYWLEGNSIIIKPAPLATSVTLTAGLKVVFDRTMDAFTITDTTQEPGFPSAFHRLISLGAAHDFAVSKTMTNQLTIIKSLLNPLQAEFEQYISKRSRLDKISIKRPNKRII
jgi:hypothetical protein